MRDLVKRFAESLYVPLLAIDGGEAPSLQSNNRDEFAPSNNFCRYCNLMKNGRDRDVVISPPKKRRIMDFECSWLKQ